MSLNTPGCVYKALEIPTDTPVISDVARQNLLDVLCCFYDFSRNEPKNNNELRDPGIMRTTNETKAQMEGMWWLAAGKKVKNLEEPKPEIEEIF